MIICHLHIGMHKTGSSSIQNYLDKNRNKLLEHDFYYAEMGSPNHSGPLLYALCFEPENDSEIKHIKISSDELKRRTSLYKKRLKESLNKKNSNIIFSAESIIKLTSDELITFKKYLLDFVDEIKLYCYVREPLPFITSSFQQIIKTIPVHLDNNNLYPNYKEKFQKFEKVFGKVNYRIFSKNELSGGDVVYDFCSWLNLPFFKSETANISLGALAIKFLYRFQHARKIISISQRQLDLLESTLVKLPYQKIILPTKEMTENIEKNAPDFYWMSNCLIENGISTKFDVDSLYTDSFGNFHGVFTETEKSILNELASSSDEFDKYIKEETGMSVLALVSARLNTFHYLDFYTRRLNDSTIVGWANYSNNDQKNVEFTVHLNNEYITTVIANLYRADLKNKTPEQRFVGYSCDFKRALLKDDLVTFKIEDKVVFSGSFIDF